MKHTILALSFLLPIFATAAGNVEVLVELNPMGNFSAKSAAVEGSAQTVGTGIKAERVAVKLDSFETGISLRNDHMKQKYFETTKGPQYTHAVIEKVTGSDGKFTGTMQLHGKSVPISGTYKVEGAKVSAEFKCKVSDFGIAAANYKGVGVEDEVTVKGSIPLAAAGAASR